MTLVTSYISLVIFHEIASHLMRWLNSVSAAVRLPTCTRASVALLAALYLTPDALCNVIYTTTTIFFALDWCVRASSSLNFADND